MILKFTHEGKDSEGEDIESSLTLTVTEDKEYEVKTTENVWDQDTVYCGKDFGEAKGKFMESLNAFMENMMEDQNE